MLSSDDIKRFILQPQPQRWSFPFLLLLLTGCFEDKTTAPSPPVACYDIISHEGPPPSPVLINKCTGQTWMVLYSDVSDVDGKTMDKIYQWYLIPRSEEDNATK
jgi:hypothetical protein